MEPEDTAAVSSMLLIQSPKAASTRRTGISIPIEKCSMLITFKG